MDMFTSYGHIKKPKKITDFLMILVWASPFKDNIRHQSAIFENSWPTFYQIWIIFTHLKLWIASARHNFKWVKIQIE